LALLLLLRLQTERLQLSANNYSLFIKNELAAILYEQNTIQS